MKQGGVACSSERGFITPDCKCYAKTAAGRKMQVVIVSGGASGIGQAICEVFIKEDSTVQVVCGDVNETAGKALEEKYDVRCKFIKTDCGDGASCMNLIQKTIELYGRIDVLVNNVGVQVGRWYTDSYVG